MTSAHECEDRLGQPGLHGSAASRFAPPPFDDAVMVGRVEPTAARLWLRTARPGRHRIELGRRDRPMATAEVDLQPPPERDRTTSLSLSADVPGLPALQPGTRYDVGVHRLADGRALGQVHFETPPGPGARTEAPVSIGVMSCYQPFDADGSVSPRARAMLRAARTVLRQHDTKLVLAIGDQIYVDQPKRLSMFGSAERVQPRSPAGFVGLDATEVRQLYQRRYRTLWNVPEWQALHADQPVLPMLDDHDIADNFGSDPAHHSPGWAAVRRGALAAYFDYQGTRERPPDDTVPMSFHYHWRWGPVAGFAMDMRTPRSCTGAPRLCNDAQLDDLERWLDDSSDVPALVLSVGQPLVNVPRLWTRVFGAVLRPGNDFVDRIDHPRYDRDRGRIVELLLRQRRRRPEQPLVVVGGDIHIGALHRLQPHDGSSPFAQVISSAICNRPPAWQRAASAVFLRLVRTLRDGDGRGVMAVRRWRGIRGSRRNPYLGCNVGLLEIDPRRAPTGVRLSVWGERGGEPFCALSSSG